MKKIIITLGIMSLTLTGCLGGGGSTLPENEVCGDSIDNDGDELIDCLDTDCSSDEACQADPNQSEKVEAKCNDDLDNDGDLAIDCDDTDCSGDSACKGTPTLGGSKIEIKCNDGLDDDEDNLIDCSDSDCATENECNTTHAETICNDALDDDSDGVIDCLDSDCATDTSCAVVLAESSCTDAIDNDSDGLVDCSDIECQSDTACLPVVDPDEPVVPSVGEGYVYDFNPYDDTLDIVAISPTGTDTDKFGAARLSCPVSEPCQSLSQALSVSDSNSRIIALEGTYSLDDVAIRKPVKIYGGFYRDSSNHNFLNADYNSHATVFSVASGKVLSIEANASLTGLRVAGDNADGAVLIKNSSPKLVNLSLSLKGLNGFTGGTLISIVNEDINAMSINISNSTFSLAPLGTMDQDVSNLAIESNSVTKNTVLDIQNSHFEATIKSSVGNLIVSNIFSEDSGRQNLLSIISKDNSFSIAGQQNDSAQNIHVLNKKLGTTSFYRNSFYSKLRGQALINQSRNMSLSGKAQSLDMAQNEFILASATQNNSDAGVTIAENINIDGLKASSLNIYNNTFFVSAKNAYYLSHLSFDNKTSTFFDPIIKFVNNIMYVSGDLSSRGSIKLIKHADALSTTGDFTYENNAFIISSFLTSDAYAFYDTTANSGLNSANNYFQIISTFRSSYLKDDPSFNDSLAFDQSELTFSESLQDLVLDAGDMPLFYSATLPGNASDLLGATRVVDGDGDGNPVVDIGAVELQIP